MAWYFLDSRSKLADFYNILHLPYTAMVLSFVVAGTAAAPQVHLDRLVGAVVAYFLGLGIGAHALDQLEPGGSHYVGSLSRRELATMAALGEAAGVAIGMYYALTVTLWLVPLIALGLLFALAYPFPSRLLGGILHNNLSFSFAWGFLPFVTSYFVNSIELTPTSVVGGGLAALVAGAEVRLSRPARAARRAGRPRAAYAGLERKLKVLVVSTCLAALIFLVARLA
jgi:hypothetical protein